MMMTIMMMTQDFIKVINSGELMVVYHGCHDGYWLILVHGYQ